MTPTATYIASENCLQEISQIEAPKYRVSHWPHGSLQYYNSLKAWGEYNAHLATLRTIPCSPECKGLWPDKAVLEEGRDYEVRYVYEPGHSLREMFAFPVAPVKSEDDLWRDLFLHLHITAQRYEPPSGGFHPGLPNDEKWHRYTIEELKSKYSLTKKQ